MSKPNSDLGLNEGDEAYFQRQFPKIADHLIWPDLIQEFRVHEDEAKRLKRGSQQNSLYAIFLFIASLSLTMLASSKLLEGTITADPTVEFLFALFSVASLCFAFGFGKSILFGRRRDEWLTNRLAAERIRQFHFQFLLANIREICSDSVLERNSVLNKRDKALEKALRRLRSPSYRQTVRDDSTLNEGLLLSIPDCSDCDLDMERYGELKRFWKELRFDWQTNYATENLYRRARGFSFKSLADKEHTVSIFEFVFTLVILAAQVFIVICHLMVLQPFDASLTMFWEQCSVALLLVVNLFAIFVVGLQTYKDGMGLTEDLSRNRAYATYAAKLTREFVTADIQANRRVELTSMKELETLTYFETREFLNAHIKAKFTL